MQQALKAGVSAYVIAGLQPQRLLPVLQVAIARFEQDRALRGATRDRRRANCPNASWSSAPRAS